MKTIVWKAYWDFQKEEVWINQMASKGYSMTDYSWCRYVFEETPKSQSIYRIELLQHLPSHPESQSYLRFLEESGITVVASYMRWVYLKRPLSEGPFELYTDQESLLKYYTRYLKFWTVLIWLELGAGAMNLVIGLNNLNHLDSGLFSIGIGMLPIAIGIGLLKMCTPIRAKVKQLKREMMVHE